MPFSYTEGNHAAEFIHSTANANRSFENIVLTGSAPLAAGTVLGRKTTPVVTADGDNTGDADLSGVTVTLGDEYQDGVYNLLCTAVATNSGTFAVIAPDGTELANLTVAVAYASDHINLTLPDGTPDWAVGDRVTVTVGGNLMAAFDPDASDGSEIARAILVNAADPSAGDVVAYALTGEAEVKGVRLTWPAGITNAQKLAAVNALKTRDIKVRD